jgi:hypothetical protein
MKHVVEFPMESGGVLLVEVDDAFSSGPTMRGASGHGSDMLERAQITYEQAVDRIRPAAESIVQRIRQIAEPPDEISVEFGIKLNANIGAILASTSAEAQFTLKMTWNRAALEHMHDIQEVNEVTDARDELSLNPGRVALEE